MELTIQTGKKVKSLQVEQLCLFHQSKIIKAISPEHEIYYLIFHKDNYINGANSQSLQQGSYLQQAFTRGVCLSNNHPVLHELISNKTFPLVRFQLFNKKLAQQYSPIESSLILTYFDQFLPEEMTTDTLKQTYYDLRRNGKMSKAYQTIQILSNHRPDNQFSKDMRSHLDFQRYEEKYQNLDELQNIDSFTYERVCFQEPEYRDRLLSLYQEEDRTIDAFILHYDQLKRNFDQTDWHEVEQGLEKYSNEEQLYCYTELIKENPALLQVPVFANKLLTKATADFYIQFVLEDTFKLDELDHQLLITQLHDANPHLLAHYFNHPKDQLVQLTKDCSTKETEAIVLPFIKAFLMSKSISEVIEWLEPFHHYHKQLSFDAKLQTMQQLQEDPDQQGKLGELYVQFEQWEQAMNCFKWEVELNPTNLSIVRALIDLLKKTNNQQEAEAYQSLLIQTEKYRSIPF